MSGEFLNFHSGWGLFDRFSDTDGSPMPRVNKIAPFSTPSSSYSLLRCHEMVANYLYAAVI